MKIAVLGGGHGCYAAAADLSSQGHQVALWRRNAAEFEAIRAQGGIAMLDTEGRQIVPIAQTTDDIGLAVRDAELLLMPLPAPTQRDLARLIAPHVHDGQVIFLPPGTFGSWVIAQELERAGSRARLAFAETGTLPWLARKRGPADVAITIRAVRLPTGVFPLSRADEAFAVIRRAFASVLPCGDALSGALMNAGPIIHPPLILMNAAPLEHFPRWDIHNEGTQPSVRAVTSQLDAERMAVREALGYGAPHYPLADHYSSDRWMYGDAHKRLTDSGDWREQIALTTHRYMTEDVVFGLAFLASVARKAGVDAPVAHGLLAMAGAILGHELRYGERTLEGLHLADLSVHELQDQLR